jgi:hypothetical protein
MKKKHTMPKPSNNFVVRFDSQTAITAATAQEALRLASIHCNKQVKTEGLNDEESVKILWLMAKGHEGKKLIHSFSLPWNLKFQPSTMTLIQKDVENGDKPNEVGTGRISKKTADAISPSVLNNHTAQIDSLTESMKEVNAAFKSQLALNQAFESRLTALEKAVKALQDAQKPLPVVTTKPKADALDEVINLVNSGEATIAPKKESKPKASKKKTTSSLESTMALLFS